MCMWLEELLNSGEAKFKAVWVCASPSAPTLMDNGGLKVSLDFSLILISPEVWKIMSKETITMCRSPPYSRGISRSPVGA